MGKNILLWSPRPLERLDVDEILSRNLIGSNSGNMLFHSSVERALMTDDDTRIITLFYPLPENYREKLEEYNSSCTCFVMPLANAFRRSYLPILRQLTELLRALTIPCIVVGAGIQLDTLSQLEEESPIDADVREFVQLVLEKSAMLGVRGARTAQYLKRLGFREESDFTVIGCPSMFWYGPELPELRQTELKPGSNVVLNAKPKGSAELHRLLARGCAQFDSYRYIPQTLEEFWLLRCGIPLWGHRKMPSYLPADKKSALFAEGRIIGFLNAQEWIGFLKSCDFAFGCNIHGNIAALLAGMPGLILNRDLRVQELAEYFEIPNYSIDTLKPDYSIFELYERADYGAMRKNHRQRFEHYRDFLQKNGLEAIFAENDPSEELPYDRRMRALGFEGPVTPELCGGGDPERMKIIYCRAAKLRRANWKKRVRRVLRRCGIRRG